MRGFVFSMWALMAAAFAGCAEDVSDAIKGYQTQVEVIPTFHNSSKRGTTRAVDGLDDKSTGFSCLYSASASDAQSPDSKAKVMVDDGSSNYIPYAYRVTGSSELTVEGDAPVFPSEVNAVNVYGWYPYTADNTFSIKADQSKTTGYCLSDLMLANKAQCTRDANGVTPAPLAFRHAMSKVKIVLAPVEGVTVKSVKLMNVKPTVTIDDTDKDNLKVGAAEGEAGDVHLLSDGSITSASEATDRTLTAVIPAQTIDAAFIQIIADINGTESTITYDFSGSAKTFEAGQEYTAYISVTSTDTGDPTIDISDWAKAGGTACIGSSGPLALMLNGSKTNKVINITTTRFSADDTGNIVVLMDGLSPGSISYSYDPYYIGIASTDLSIGNINFVGEKVGSTQIYVSALKDGKILSAVVDVNIAKGSPRFEISNHSISVYKNTNHSAPLRLTWYGDGIVSYTSSNPDIATATVNDRQYPFLGKEVTVHGGSTTGTATLTFYLSEGTDHLPATTTLTVTTIARDHGVALADATVGMIIAENGKAYTVDNYDASFGKKVAVVAYTGAAGRVDSSDGSSGYHGLAIALNDANDGQPCQYFTRGGIQCLENYGLYSGEFYGKGIDNTNKLAGGCGAGHFHAAAQVAKEYKYDASVAAGAHPTGTSQWFLPTLYQWDLIVKGMCGNYGDLGGWSSSNDHYTAANFNVKITAAGGTGVKIRTSSDYDKKYWYWASKESDDRNGAFAIDFYVGRSHNIYKTEDQVLVRPVIAF